MYVSFHKGILRIFRYILCILVFIFYASNGKTKDSGPTSNRPFRKLVWYFFLRVTKYLNFSTFWNYSLAVSVLSFNTQINSCLSGSWWPGHFSQKFSPSAPAQPKVCNNVSHRFRQALSGIFCSSSFLLRTVEYRHSPMDSQVHDLVNVNSEMNITLCQSARLVGTSVVWLEQLVVCARLFSINLLVSATVSDGMI